MEKEPTAITMRKDLKIRANKAILEGKFPGISNLSALIEYSLSQVLDQIEEKVEA